MMKQQFLIVSMTLLAFSAVATSEGNTVFSENFEDSSGYTVGGCVPAYWGIAPLEGTQEIPSYFLQGGSQSGNIFYGSFAKENDDSPPATMTINLPDLIGYPGFNEVLNG